jgi:hypothetical protein
MKELRNAATGRRFSRQSNGKSAVGVFEDAHMRKRSFSAQSLAEKRRPLTALQS